MEGKGGFYNKSFILVFLLFALAVAKTVQGQGTRVGFYSSTCPRAESIVRATVQSHLKSGPTLAAGLLRMHFHDCFVQGCDGSVLIVGTNSERTAPPNLGLRGFEVIDDAKTQLETACPGVVSCADILALAARDSVALSGGPSWKVPTGRRDGRVSRTSDVNLPGPGDSVDVQKQKFAARGLNAQDLVTLVGGHTIGTTACQFFSSRIYNFNGTNGPDPAIDSSFVPQLQALCPQNSGGSNRVALDNGSQNKFDTSYFNNLRKGRGILQSDQALWTDDASTKSFVQRYLGVSDSFNVEFGNSMVKMSNIGVKTAPDGEIRNLCSAFN